MKHSASYATKLDRKQAGPAHKKILPFLKQDLNNIKNGYFLFLSERK
jgi:hypothetical protein